MKKTSKIVIALAVAMMIIVAVTPVFATNVNPTLPTDGGKLGEMGNTITGYIKYIGMFVAVGVIMIMGIKYMMGSVEEKADYKKTMIPLVIGIVLLVAAVWIADAIVEFVTTTTKESGTLYHIEKFIA